MCLSFCLSSRSLRLLVVLSVSLLSTGCLNPWYGYGRPYGYGNPYGQQYAPPPSPNSNPGSLYIPESNAPPYEPTYNEKADDFDKSGSDGQFYEGGVPQPQDYKDRDLGVSNDQYDFGGDIRQVSASSPSDAEYGFDFQDYSFLKGVLRYNGTGDGWAVNYSPAARDQFAGTLTLDMTSAQAQGLVEGDFVEVRGQIDLTQQDQSGAPIYRVSSIQVVE